jgi:LemA protein
LPRGRPPPEAQPLAEIQDEVRMPIYGWIATGIATLAAVWLAWAFNRLIRQRNLLREAWSGIEVQLKRRHDLVPNLVECVQGYRAHERGLFEVIAAQRARALEARGAAAASAEGNRLAEHLRRLFAVAEAYPELKADRNFRQLSDNLIEIEDQLQYARRYYNGTVRDINTLIETFPGMIPAKIFHFQAAEFFEIENAAERQAPAVTL